MGRPPDFEQWPLEQRTLHLVVDNDRADLVEQLRAWIEEDEDADPDRLTKEELAQLIIKLEDAHNEL